MSDTDGKRPPPSRWVLSTDDFPAHVDDRERARLWMERNEALFVSTAVTYAEDYPFFARIAITRFGGLQLVEGSSTMTRVERTKREIATDGVDDFYLGVNLGGPITLSSQRGQEMQLARGAMGLTSTAEPGDAQAKPGGKVWTVGIARSALSELIKDPDDLVMRTINPDAPATRLLMRYLSLLFETNGLESDPVLTEHVDRTVSDLVALALGASRESAEIAAARGTRAARLHLVLADIKSTFDDPHFSEHVLAANLGLSARYIRDLLQETGTSFSERVLELRLQKARRMLTDAKNHRMKVSDIAYACGFNEVSYFNRRFRRRFGASPTQYRP